jgi:hypothetical protein
MTAGWNQKSPALVRTYLVTLTFASWNHTVQWLRRLEASRRQGSSRGQS